MAVDKSNYLAGDGKLIVVIDLLNNDVLSFHSEGKNASHANEVPLHLQFERLVQDLARNGKH